MDFLKSFSTIKMVISIILVAGFIAFTIILKVLQKRSNRVEEDPEEIRDRMKQEEIYTSQTKENEDLLRAEEEFSQNYDD